MSPWLALPLLVLVAWLWVTTRALARIRGQLDDAESRLARRFYKLQGRLAEMDAIIRELDCERRRQRGEIRFGPETRLVEAMKLHPRVGEILAGFGLAGSGCSGGGFDGEATLAEACGRARLDLGSVLAELERFLQNPGAPVHVEPASARLYQIGGLR